MRRCAAGCKSEDYEQVHRGRTESGPGDTGRLLQDSTTREYDLDDILAEFGTGAVKPQQPRPESRRSPSEPVSQPQQPEPEDPAAEPAPEA